MEKKVFESKDGLSLIVVGKIDDKGCLPIRTEHRYGDYNPYKLTKSEAIELIENIKLKFELWR